MVALDANPVMCAAAETNFRDYIRSGQLKVINRGIAEQKGQLEFWVCDDVTQWSSFHRDIASRNGAKHHAINVDCVPIMDVIDEFRQVVAFVVGGERNEESRRVWGHLRLKHGSVGLGLGKRDWHGKSFLEASAKPQAANNPRKRRTGEFPFFPT